MKNDMEVIDKKKIWMRKMAVVIYRWICLLYIKCWKKKTLLFEIKDKYNKLLNVALFILSVIHFMLFFSCEARREKKMIVNIIFVCMKIRDKHLF